jgi:hypothetical protein
MADARAVNVAALLTFALWVLIGFAVVLVILA